MTTQKDVITLLDSLEDGFNRALPNCQTGIRGAWQPRLDVDGNVMETYCNFFVISIAQAFSYEKLNGRTANEIYDFVSNPANGWLKIDGEIAQSHANDGCLVIAGWKNPCGHGHVCLICPGKMQPSGTFGKNVPKCVNIGKDVFFGKKVSYAFRQEPDYFVLGEMV